MSNQLVVLFDLLSSGFKVEFLEILSLIALLFGIAVITIKNPISSLMCLIGLFSAISVYLIVIGLNFIGFSYLIVYIGAVSILFLFILMLINIRTSELLSNNINSIPLALLIIILLNYAWIQLSPEYGGIFNNITGNLVYTNLLGNFLESVFVNKNMINIMFITSNNWDGFMTETSHIVAVGMILYTVFNMWLLLASLILLLAMVGSIIITIKKKGFSSVVEYLFYTQEVKGSIPLIPRYDKFFNLTVKCIFDKNEI
uniref:NADH-ubiquinone oxidoreductase chain 6 n=1 Tax=Hapsidospora chrysogena TaxID=5044 RepID=V9VIZ5_HAPCH|nr:NADH dehydrogenase subunit 6 [Hapsidospora chrysogena]AHC94755.1 NADH dehydrogenase subunit 6 [Hapsidospora chrysogena]